VTTPGEQIVAEAWAAFEAWCKEFDPDGELTTFEQVEAYSNWADDQ
jgi:hypothetical protein